VARSARHEDWLARFIRLLAEISGDDLISSKYLSIGFVIPQIKAVTEQKGDKI
jgi:hypothetical protein